RTASAGPGTTTFDRRQHLADPLLQACRQLLLRALGLDHRLEVDTELELVGARSAPRHVSLDLHPDDVIDLSVQEALQLPERFLTVGPAIIHRQVPVPWPYPTTRAPTLSFPDGACS